MSWHPPKNQNGAIAGYHVFHIHENQTGVEIVKRNAADSAITFELPKLSKYKTKIPPSILTETYRSPQSLFHKEPKNKMTACTIHSFKQNYIRYCSIIINDSAKGLTKKFSQVHNWI